MLLIQITSRHLIQTSIPIRIEPDFMHIPTATIFVTIALMMSTLSVGQAAPRVVVSIAPIHSIVAAIMDGIGKPLLLLDQKTSPHDFSLKPSQARLLQSADLVVWVGEKMETPLKKPISALVPPDRMETLLQSSTFSSRPGQNPHIWLNPEQAKQIADMLAARLSDLDGGNSRHYRQNAETFKLVISNAEKDIVALLASVKSQPFIAMHNAYQPFVKYFGLNSVGVVKQGRAAGPGVASLLLIRKRIAAENIVCVTFEYGENSRQIDVLIEGASINSIALDPLGAKLTPGKSLFSDLIRNLAKDLAECLN